LGKTFWGDCQSRTFCAIGIFGGLAPTFPEEQITAALNKLVADPSDPARILVTFLAQRWAATSPADAAQWAMRHLTDDIFGRNVLSKVMVLWAGKDLAGAVAWIQKVPADGHKAAAALALATEAAGLGKAVIAINLATNLPPGSERDDLFSCSAQQWAATDKDSALAWIKKFQIPRCVKKYWDKSPSILARWIQLPAPNLWQQRCRMTKIGITQ
jgi:hypothetical protein